MCRSLQHLQGALPILSSAANQDQLDEDHDLQRINDPLREFLVDRQKISDAKTDTKNDVDISGLAIGKIKGNAKKFLRQSVKTEVVGFDAIREEEETISSVAFKASVSAPKVSKDCVRTSEQPQLVQQDSKETETLSHTEPKSIEVESGHVEASTPTLTDVIVSSESNTSSTYSCAPSPQVILCLKIGTVNISIPDIGIPDFSMVGFSNGILATVYIRKPDLSERSNGRLGHKKSPTFEC
jgi:hypothetical protein